MSARLNAASVWTELTSGAGPLRYQLDSPTGRVSLDFEDVAGSVDRLTMDAGGSAPINLVRVQR